MVQVGLADQVELVPQQLVLHLDLQGLEDLVDQGVQVVLVIVDLVGLWVGQEGQWDRDRVDLEDLVGHQVIE